MHTNTGPFGGLLVGTYVTLTNDTDYFCQGSHLSDEIKLESYQLHRYPLSRLYSPHILVNAYSCQICPFDFIFSHCHNSCRPCTILIHARDFTCSGANTDAWSELCEPLCVRSHLQQSHCSKLHLWIYWFVVSLVYILILLG